MDYKRVDKLFGSPIKKFKKMEEEKGKMNISNQLFKPSEPLIEKNYANK